LPLPHYFIGKYITEEEFKSYLDKHDMMEESHNKQLIEEKPQQTQSHKCNIKKCIHATSFMYKQNKLC